MPGVEFPAVRPIRGRQNGCRCVRLCDDVCPGHGDEHRTLRICRIFESLPDADDFGRWHGLESGHAILAAG